ncbi:MAG TPA: hypothetical protein VI636_17455 [Candidatus Angelobacter sp.]
MNHEFAIGSKAAERYVLGEMNEAERDAYEEHFFSCAVCAEEVKATDELLCTIRQAIPGPSMPPARRPRLPGPLQGLLSRLMFWWSSRIRRRNV